MYTKFKFLFCSIFLLVVGCKNGAKNKLIIYPEYCKGCVVRNFEALKNEKLFSEFDVVFDTTDLYLTTCARNVGVPFQHVNNSEIPAKFGDFANLVIVNKESKTFELRTDETLKKGSHF